MSDNIEQGFKIFEFLRDKGFRDTISSFLVGAFAVSIGWYAYTDSRIENELELKEDYKKRNNELTAERNFLKDKLIQADEDCTSRVMFFNQMIEDIKNNKKQAENKSKELADKQVQTKNELNEIKNKLTKL